MTEHRSYDDETWFASHEGPEPPGPTEEDYCRAQGHAYYADEWNWRDAPPEQREEARLTAGRCYCGARRYEAFAEPVETPAPKEGQ